MNCSTHDLIMDGDVWQKYHDTFTYRTIKLELELETLKKENLKLIVEKGQSLIGFNLMYKTMKGRFGKNLGKRLHMRHLEHIHMVILIDHIAL